ncbi:MAG: GNAT family N-acetyltransferase [Pseudomonadota bacterium]
MTHTSFPIRRAGPDDVDDLSRIGRDTFTETFGHLYTPENLHSFLQESHSAEWYSYALRQPDVACWIVRGETGAPMAYAVAGPNTLPVEVSTPEAGEVKRVYVRQGAQGLGLGGQLLAA